MTLGLRLSDMRPDPSRCRQRGRSPVPIGAGVGFTGFNLEI